MKIKAGTNPVSVYEVNPGKEMEETVKFALTEAFRDAKTNAEGKSYVRFPATPRISNPGVEVFYDHGNEHPLSTVTVLESTGNQVTGLQVGTEKALFKLAAEEIGRYVTGNAGNASKN